MGENWVSLCKGWRERGGNLHSGRLKIIESVKRWSLPIHAKHFVCECVSENQRYSLVCRMTPTEIEMQMTMLDNDGIFLVALHKLSANC